MPRVFEIIFDISRADKERGQSINMVSMILTILILGALQTSWLILRNLDTSIRPLWYFLDLTTLIQEIGATVCTPQTPNCEECPVSADCAAYAEAQLVTKGRPVLYDIEDSDGPFRI